MDRLDLEAVFKGFAALAKLTDEEAEAYRPTVKSAKAYFERLILRDFEPEGEKDLCEYACACKAFFDYTVFCAASIKSFSSQTGGIYTRVLGSETVKNAERLMRNSFAALPPGLIRDDGFVFEGAEG